MALGHGQSYLSWTGRVMVGEPLFDSKVHGATCQAFHTCCDGKGTTFTIISTTTSGDLCGISSGWSSAGTQRADPESVLFDATGPHPTAPGSAFAVCCDPDLGPSWGNAPACLFTHVVGGKWMGGSATNIQDYPSWRGTGPLAITRVAVHSVVESAQSVSSKMEKALEKIDDSIVALERSFGQRLEGMRAAMEAGAVARPHAGGGDNTRELQAAIVTMAMEVSGLKALIEAPKAVFWVRLIEVGDDPAVASGAVAFLVAPLVGVVDGLKDAVKGKVPEMVKGTVIGLRVWGCDTAAMRWAPMPEDADLVPNGMATAYHVVV